MEKITIKIQHNELTYQRNPDVKIHEQRLIDVILTYLVLNELYTFIQWHT